MANEDGPAGGRGNVHISSAPSTGGLDALAAVSQEDGKTSGLPQLNKLLFTDKPVPQADPTIPNLHYGSRSPIVGNIVDGTNTDTQAIAVTVSNLNDNAPLISSNGGGATAAISIPENSTAVTTVTATDADAGATLTYSIVGGADAAKFTIDSATGALAFVSAPDYESPTDAGGDNVYDVTVKGS